MKISYNKKDNNGKITNHSIEKPTLKECYEEIYKEYNRCRYTISLLWLDVKNDDFWAWVRSLTIGEYYSFEGKID